MQPFWCDLVVAASFAGSFWTASCHAFHRHRCIRREFQDRQHASARRSRACCLVPEWSPSPDCAWSFAEDLTCILRVSQFADIGILMIITPTPLASHIAALLLELVAGSASVRQTISFHYDIHTQHRLVLDSFNVSSQLKHFVK